MSHLSSKSTRQARSPKVPKATVLRRPWVAGLLAVLLPLLTVFATGWVFGPPAAAQAAETTSRIYHAVRDELIDLFTKDPVKMPLVVQGSRTLKGPLLTVIAIDGSSSMAESDPDGQRWRDLQALRRWFVRNESPVDEVALVKFSTEAISGPRRKITDRGAFNEASVADPFSGGTRLLPAVDSASGLFQENPRAKACLLLITDGISDDIEEAQRAARAASDCPPLIIALTEGDWGKVKGQWTNADGFKVVPTGGMRSQVVAAIAARHVMAQVGQRERQGKGGN